MIPARRGSDHSRQMRRIALVVPIVAAVAIAGCFLPGRGPKELPVPRYSPARDTLLSVDVSRGDSLSRRGFGAAMGSFLDREVIYLRAGAHAAYGSERAAAALASAAPQAGAFTGWQPLGGGISRDGLRGYTFGIAVRALPELQTALIERYVAFWTRSRGSPWRIAAYVEVSPGNLTSSPGEKPSPVLDTARVLRQMVTADSTFAEVASLRGPAVASRGAFSEDGVLLTTTQLVVGSRGAGDYFDSRRSFSLSWVPRDGRIAASGDLGFTTGDALSTSLGPTGAAVQSFTKYLTVWRKEPDGRWRVLVTGANDRPSPIGN
jgi:hypothetical protein